MGYRATVAFILVLAVGNVVGMCANHSVASEQVKTIDYDTFGKLDLQGRHKVLNEISPENMAEIMKTHVKRWLEKNRNHLSQEQISVLEESITSITADSYRFPRSNEAMKRAKELAAKAAAVFSQEEMVQALTLDGDYIPPQK